MIMIILWSKLASHAICHLHRNGASALLLQVTTRRHRTPVANWNGRSRKQSSSRITFNTSSSPPHNRRFKERRLNAFSVFYHLSPIRLRAPSLCFLKQEVNVPLFCSQTQQVQKAMDEKRFEDAVKLRGRYDRNVRRVQ